MSEMVERVARAIAVAELGDKDSSAIELFLPRFEKHARAAIEVLREPTEAMLKAMEAEELQGSDGPWPGEPENVWRAAIDAALSPKE